MFEEIQKYFIKDSKIDRYDILRTMAGGLIGLIILFLLPSNILFTIFAVVTVIIMLLEFYFNFYLKLKK
jgi:Mn2+/Fe2+ NRAMP family transporter